MDLPVAASQSVVGVLGALAGAITAIVAGGVGIITERFKQGRERQRSREEGFELAQTGYRACYEDFLNVAAATLNDHDGSKPNSDVLDELYRHFDKVCLTGDPLVTERLLAYWPQERRDQREPPEQMPTPELFTAMAEHGYRSVRAQDQLKDHRSRYSPARE